MDTRLHDRNNPVEGQRELVFHCFFLPKGGASKQDVAEIAEQEA